MKKALLILAFALLLTGNIAETYYWYTHPRIIQSTTTVTVLQELEACKKWGGNWNIGTPIDPDVPRFIFDYGSRDIYPPYKKLDNDWAESCTKSNTTSQSLY